MRDISAVFTQGTQALHGSAKVEARTPSVFAKRSLKKECLFQHGINEFSFMFFTFILIGNTVVKLQFLSCSHKFTLDMLTPPLSLCVELCMMSMIMCLSIFCL